MPIQIPSGVCGRKVRSKCFVRPPGNRRRAGNAGVAMHDQMKIGSWVQIGFKPCLQSFGVICIKFFLKCIHAIALGIVIVETHVQHIAKAKLKIRKTVTVVY